MEEIKLRIGIRIYLVTSQNTALIAWIGDKDSQALDRGSLKALVDALNRGEKMIDQFEPFSLEEEFKSKAAQNGKLKL